MSADGKVVVGEMPVDGHTQAFRWTASSGATPLGTLPTHSSLGPFSRAFGVSADGSIVVGESSAPNPHHPEAFRWSAETGMVSLGNLPDLPSGLSPYSSARAISDNGQVIVGAAQGQYTWYAFRWTPDTGMQSLFSFDDSFEAFQTEALDVSPDGSIIIGWAARIPGHVGFRWRAGQEVDWLAAPERHSAEPTAMTSDGAVLVGASGRGNSRTVIRWDAQDSFTLVLGSEFVQGSATDITPDGRIIVGSYEIEQEDPSSRVPNFAAFIWTAEDGVRLLSDVLSEAGVDLAGWKLTSANGISDDGSVIAGNGTNPAGQWEAWRAILR